MEKDQKNKKYSVYFDLDRTIAVRHSGDSIFKIGEPIPPMIELMKHYLADGRRVKIFTARPKLQFPQIVNWLKKQGIEGVEITNLKESGMSAFFDDRAVGCQENTGITHLDIIREARRLIGKVIRAEPLDIEQLRKWEKDSVLTIEDSLE